MENTISATVLLERYIDLLKSKLVLLDEERTLLSRELKAAEKALVAAIIERKDCAYRKQDTLREKILFYFHKKETILSISAITDMLHRIDHELGNSVKDFPQAVRLQMAKMIEVDQVVQYKLPQMKNMHYALKEWIDDIGEIRERYFGK